LLLAENEYFDVASRKSKARKSKIYGLSLKYSIVEAEAVKIPTQQANNQILKTRNIHSPRVRPSGQNSEWWKKTKARKSDLRAFERFDYYSGGDGGSRTLVQNRENLRLLHAYP
jgi:hypothetical protein